MSRSRAQPAHTTKNITMMQIQIISSSSNYSPPARFDGALHFCCPQCSPCASEILNIRAASALRSRTGRSHFFQVPARQDDALFVEERILESRKVTICAPCEHNWQAPLFSGTWSARTRPEPTQGSWVDICGDLCGGICDDIWVDLWRRPSLFAAHRHRTFWLRCCAG